MELKKIRKTGIKNHNELEKYCTQQIKEYCHSGDTEADHGTADNVLTGCLNALGFKQLVEEFNKVHKWYA